MAFWMIPAAISAGSAIIGALQKKKGPSSADRARMAGFDARVAGMGQTGQEAEAEYYKRIREFNPMQSATQAAQAQYQIAMPEILRAMANLRGAQAGTRLNTGYGQLDQDYLLQQNLNNLNQSMIARSMEAAQMQANTNRELGAYGQGLTNTYLDATYGRYQTEEDRRAQEAADRRRMWGSFAGSAAGLAGAAYGARTR